MVFQTMVYITEYLPRLAFIKIDLDRRINGDANSINKFEGEYLMGKGKQMKVKGNNY